MSNNKNAKGVAEEELNTEKEFAVSKVVPRSWLFVPAGRPERFIKAINSGADAVIIDLEDSVAIDDKAEARQHVEQFVRGYRAYKAKDGSKDLKQPSLWLRLNNNPQIEEDIALTSQLIEQQELTGVVLPKVTSASQIDSVYQAIALPLIAQIETLKGMVNIEDITKAEGLWAISYGRLDISNELNLRVDSEAEQDFFKHLRFKLLLASTACGLIPPIESVFADFKNEQGVRAIANYVSDLGFSGMLCIHPYQVAQVNEAFKATKPQLAFATKVIEHYQQTGDSVFAIDGVMVDLPLIQQCQRLLQ